MKNIRITKLLIAVLITITSVYSSTFIVSGFAFEYNWESNETPEGVESYTPVDPIHIELLGDLKQVSHHSASLILKDKYNAYLDDDIKPAHAAALLNTFSAMATDMIQFHIGRSWIIIYIMTSTLIFKGM